jgi:hypothetical protein
MRSRVEARGVLGLGLILVYLYYEFGCQSISFRADAGGVLGSGLIMQYLYYELVCPSIRCKG